MALAGQPGRHRDLAEVDDHAAVADIAGENSRRAEVVREQEVAVEVEGEGQVGGVVGRDGGHVIAHHGGDLVHVAVEDAGLRHAGVHLAADVVVGGPREMCGVDEDRRRVQVEFPGRIAADQAHVVGTEVGIADHVHIAVDAEIAQGLGVTKDVDGQPEAGRGHVGKDLDAPGRPAGDAGGEQADGVVESGVGRILHRQRVEPLAQGRVRPAVSPGAVLQELRPGALDGGVGQIEGLGRFLAVHGAAGLVGGHREEGHAGHDDDEDEDHRRDHGVAPLVADVDPGCVGSRHIHAPRRRSSGCGSPRAWWRRPGCRNRPRERVAGSRWTCRRPS